MNIKYVVKLTENEIELLLRLARKDLGDQRTRYALILLALNQSHSQQIGSYEQIGQLYGVDKSTVSQIAKRYVAGGINAALTRKEQANRHRKVDKAVQAHIVALARSKAPEGCARWTLQLIADELMRRGVIENISATAVSDSLKRVNFSLNRSGRHYAAEPVHNQ